MKTGCCGRTARLKGQAPWLPLLGNRQDRPVHREASTGHGQGLGTGGWDDSDPYGVQAFPSGDQYVLGLDGGSVAK